MGRRLCWRLRLQRAAQLVGLLREARAARHGHGAAARAHDAPRVLEVQVAAERGVVRREVAHRPVVVVPRGGQKHGLEALAGKLAGNRRDDDAGAGSSLDLRSRE